jgi:hypothetical protein
MMLDEFAEGRPELRLPKATDTDSGPVCPRCEVPLDDFDIGYVEVPADACRVEAITAVSKRLGVEAVRGRGWICPNHSRDVYCVRTCEGLAADGWREYLGIRIELDTGDDAIVPVVADDLVGGLQETIEHALATRNGGVEA